MKSLFQDANSICLRAWQIYCKNNATEREGEEKEFIEEKKSLESGSHLKKANHFWLEKNLIAQIKRTIPPFSII